MNQSAAETKAEVLVLGAGAAGMMCAIEAARRGRKVLVLERNREIGEKIRISGGGRCNFTNLYAGPDCYVSENPRFCTSALSRYTPQHFIELVERHHIDYHEKKLGQLFCDGSSRQIIDLLRSELLWAGGEIRAGVEITAVRREDGFIVAATGAIFTAPALVVATGGLSIPKMGATDLGHRIAEQFGLALTPCAPGLVPLTWSGGDLDAYADLAGVAAGVEVRCGNAGFHENLLFTHRGLSGPAILQISSYWAPGTPIEVDLLPGAPEDWLLNEKRESPRQELATVLASRLPKRLAQRLCERHGWQGVLADQKDARLREMTDSLRCWRVLPAGTEGFAKAEVTKGGVRTAELSPKTMESKKVPGLHFIGEVVDVTGWLGGYNFQWAWASGYAAGQAL